MKIVIFAPGLRSSAIGRMTALVGRALLEMGHEVIVVRTEEASLLARPSHDFGTTVIDWTRRADIERHLREADAAVYQIGDNYPFHQGCLEWLDIYPGIVCLHDFYLGHMFFGWSQGRHDEARAVLLELYGEGADAHFFNASVKSTFIEDTSTTMPLTEWIAHKALGVLTHSAGSIQRVLSSCAGPVAVTPLAYDASAISEGRGDSHEGTERLEVLTVGHINPNKRIHSVIEAIGSSGLLREKVYYRLVGPVEPHIFFELSAVARRHGVRLRISGEVDDVALTNAFGSADVVCCLRWPSLEAASASAIEAMLHAKAIIVTDTGFYRDIPTSAAIHVDPVNEVTGIRQALERLAADRELVARMGAEARKWAEVTFTPSSYAIAILEMAEAVSQTTPLQKALREFECNLGRWDSTDSMRTLAAPMEALSIRER